MFSTTPICEECGKEPATTFSDIRRVHEPSRWMFTCDCTIGTELYYVQFRRFFASPSATVDWIAHLAEKNDMDWANFVAMMERFRAATNSYGRLDG